MRNHKVHSVKLVVASSALFLAIMFACPLCNAANPDPQDSFDYSVFDDQLGFSIVQEKGTWNYSASVRKELPDLTVVIGLSVGGKLDGSVLPAELHLSAFNAQGNPAFSVNHFLVRLDGRDFEFTPLPDGPAMKALQGSDGLLMLEVLPDARSVSVIFGNKSRSVTVEFLQEELTDLETWSQNVIMWMDPTVFMLPANILF